MGGAVSSGRDNNELIDNLISGNYIRTRRVEKVFRALDRADYMTPEGRDQAYKDLAWRNGALHLSSPCIYSEVMEGLELRPGLSFLNIGSGTGYLSTLVGLILGSSGISHGVEVQPTTVEYSVMKQRQFIENSATLDDFDFCEPKFFIGNGLNLAPLQCGYDRVYCGAGCPEEYESYFKNLIKVGGILVLPINDTLQQVKRVAEDKWVSRNLLSVSFATLRVPARDEALDQIKLLELAPPRLQLLARAGIRAAMRAGLTRRHPELRERPWRPPPRHACPRRICIPIEPGGDVQNLNVLHDLDTESGANEMNALLSLVISMGQNRVAGALRFDRVARRASRDGGDSDGSDDTVDSNPNETKTDAEAIENGDEDKSATDNLDELDKSGEETKLKTDTTKDTDGTDKEESGDSKNKQEEDDNETDSQSDSSTVGGLRAKIKQLKARRDRRIAKLKRLSKKLSREIGLGKPSTSKDDEGEKDTRHKKHKDNDKSKSKESVSSDDDAAGDSSGDDDDDKPGSSGGAVEGFPSEVEIFIPKLQEPGTSAEMDWQDSRATVIGNGGEVCKSKAKRQKLDSGIGEASPGGSRDGAGGGERSASDGGSDGWEDIDMEFVGGRRRRRGASLGAGPERELEGGSEGESDEGPEGGLDEGLEDGSDEGPERELERLEARRRRAAARGGDARRARLSLLMKRAVRELPLPQPLKKFVNLGRCYEF